MEKLLRTSDDDILVYVAPTKALVSQIAAEVYARFRKELGSSECLSYSTSGVVTKRLVRRGMLGDPHKRLSRAQPSKLPDSGHCSRDAGDDVALPAFG